MRKIELRVNGMTCAHCENRVKKAVGELGGVTNVKVSLCEKKVTADIDEAAVTAQQIRDAIEEQGYDVVSAK